MCNGDGALDLTSLPTTRPGGIPSISEGTIMPFSSKGGGWQDKLKKFGQGAQQGGIMGAFDQAPAQNAPFQFSPLTQPEPDAGGSPLTQSIIASLMQQMSGRQGG